MLKTIPELEQEIIMLRDQLHRAIEQDYCTLCGRIIDELPPSPAGDDWAPQDESNMLSEIEQGRQDMCVRFMKAIVNHCRDGGSFRYLIYDRLGLRSSAYEPMYKAGGMAFSNACPIKLGEWTDEIQD